MPEVSTLAAINDDLCTKCQTCIKLCPVEALSFHKASKKIIVDENACLACTICATRCPEKAIEMRPRVAPLAYGFDYSQQDPQEIAELCHRAHMHPEQIICYCRRTQAREVAGAILAGHQTPEALAKITGIRTGCGVLCVTSVLRLLAAAGVVLEKAPGWQWYGTYVTIWDLPPEFRNKYPEYYLEEDLAYMNQLFPQKD